MNIWYYLDGAEKKGPFTLDEIKNKIFRGEISPEVRVWRDGMVGWKTISEVESSTLLTSDTVTATPSYSPEYQKATIAPHGYAGFWRRFFAYLVDIIILFVIQIVLYAAELLFPAGVATTLSFLISFMMGWLYFAFFESSSYQATPGKMALEIKVCDLNGNRISFLRATGRHFAKIISTIILYIGFIMIAFTQKKQGLHDIIAECLVIKAPEDDE